MLNNKGVTMMEVMVTIVIVGILTAIWVLNRGSQINAAIAQEGRAAVEQIISAERTYYAQYGAFYIVGTDFSPQLGVDLRKHTYFNRFDTALTGANLRVSAYGNGDGARGVVVRGTYSPADNGIVIEEEL